MFKEFSFYFRKDSTSITQARSYLWGFLVPDYGSQWSLVQFNRFLRLIKKAYI